MIKLQDQTRSGVLAVYFCGEDINTPRFIVVTDEPRWVSTLKPYYLESMVSDRAKRKIYALSFSFHALYTALLCYPPFANSVLDTERYSLEKLRTVYFAFPLLARKLNPINIQMSYQYVTPSQTEEVR
ncbi:hypothetical protein [Peromfec virus RodF8_20]|uniref:Uncharacterized protein n=1 Tax=Peromfec virus RodF8_20 TaxID=2929362 RepID=A0A976R899_9VIRU|nr:hypothetical protein [Peromfec virus RodF8_20]